MAFDYQSSKYTQYDARSHTNRDEGLIIVPLAKLPTAPPPHFRIIRVHAPIGIRNVNIEAGKVGTPPLMPIASTARSGDVLISSDLETRMPEDAVGSPGRVHRAKMQLVYVESPAGVQRARTPGVDPIPTIRAPFARPEYDSIAATIAGWLGVIPIFGQSLVTLLYSTGLIDTVYDQAAALPTVAAPAPAVPAQTPDLTTDAYFETAIDTRPNYFSGDIVR